MSTIFSLARRRWRLMLVPVAAVSVAGLAACGTGTATTSSGGATDDTAMTAFASCMAENGVSLPERGADGGQPADGDGAGSAGGAGGPGGAGGGAAGPGAGGADGGSPPTGAPQAGGAGGGARPAPPGVDATALAAAQEACAQYAPTPPSS